MEDLWKLFYLWGLRSKNPLERMNEDFPSLDMLKDQAATYLAVVGGWPIWRCILCGVWAGLRSNSAYG